MTYIRFAAAFSRSGEGAAFLLPGGRRRWPVFPQAVGRYHRQHQQPPQQSPGARRFPVKEHDPHGVQQWLQQRKQNQRHGPI